MRRFAVFTTSEIFSTYKTSKSCDEKFVTDDGTVIYSTGKLERAIEQGYRPIVVSTRSKLGDHDKWWIQLIIPSDLYITGEVPPADAAYNEALIAPWKKLYKRLRLEYPQQEDDGGELKDVFWLAARAQLPRHGVQLGDYFREE